MVVWSQLTLLGKIWKYLENGSAKFCHRGWDLIPQMSSMILWTSLGRLNTCGF